MPQLLSADNLVLVPCEDGQFLSEKQVHLFESEILTNLLQGESLSNTSFTIFLQFLYK
jgi:hypothetical protein